MFDIGWSELLLIGVAALIVIGPEDLPRMFRALGRITARARQMAREFSSAMEDAARTSGLDDAAGTLRDVKSMTSSKALGLDALDRAAERFEKWDPKLPTRSGGPIPDPSQPAPPAAEADAPPPAVPPAVPAAPPAAEAGPAPRRQLHAVRRSGRADVGGPVSLNEDR